jgi:hypothetical protein
VAVLVLAALPGIATAEEVRTAGAGYWTPKRPPRARYRIDCTIELGDELRLEGRETIHFVNTTSRPIQTLAVTWFKVPGQTLKITAGGKVVALPGPAGTFPKDFTLAEPVAAGESLKLEVEFGLAVSAAPERLDNIGPISDWPRLWWGIPSHDDYEVKFDVPAEYEIATSGRLDPKTGYFHAEGVPSFGLFLGRGYKVLEDKAGDVEVRCLYKPADKKCAELLQETAVDVINFYRQWLGFYPYRILTIIPGMDRPAGGYPVAANIVSIHGMGRMAEKPQLHWQWIAAHEIGHQYWSRYVMEKDEPGWLWIGLGIYADRQYCRARGLGMRKHRELMARYIKGVREGHDTTVARSQEERSGIKFDFNNVVTHGKGFSIISALDCLLGDEIFGRVHHRCLKEYAGRRLGLHEFRAVCERESGQDLGWFFDQWVNSNKYLSYEIASKKCEKKGDAYVSEVEVRCLGTLKMPVPVEAGFEDGTTQRAFTNRLRDADTIRFESKSALKDVRLDPDDVLALVVPPPAPDEAQLGKAVQDLPWTGAGGKALEVFEKAQKGKMSDPGRWFKLGMTLYDGEYYEQALTAFKQSQTHGKGDPMRVCVALLWQGHLLDLLDRRDEALKCYNEALKDSANLNMRHDQYGMKLDRQWVQKRLAEPFRRE